MLNIKQLISKLLTVFWAVLLTSLHCYFFMVMANVSSTQSLTYYIVALTVNLFFIISCFAIQRLMVKSCGAYPQLTSMYSKLPLMAATLPLVSYLIYVLLSVVAFYWVVSGEIPSIGINPLLVVSTPAVLLPVVHQEVPGGWSAVITFFLGDRDLQAAFAKPGLICRNFSPHSNFNAGLVEKTSLLAAESWSLTINTCLAYFAPVPTVFTEVMHQEVVTPAAATLERFDFWRDNYVNFSTLHHDTRISVVLSEKCGAFSVETLMAGDCGPVTQYTYATFLPKFYENIMPNHNWDSLDDWDRNMFLNPGVYMDSFNNFAHSHIPPAPFNSGQPWDPKYLIPDEAPASVFNYTGFYYANPYHADLKSYLLFVTNLSRYSCDDDYTSYPEGSAVSDAAHRYYGQYLWDSSFYHDFRLHEGQVPLVIPRELHAYPSKKLYYNYLGFDAFTQFLLRHNAVQFLGTPNLLLSQRYDVVNYLSYFYIKTHNHPYGTAYLELKHNYQSQSYLSYLLEVSQNPQFSVKGNVKFEVLWFDNYNKK